MIRRAIRRLLRAAGRRPSDAASSGSAGTLQRRAATLSQTVFLGGPLRHLERYGRLQFIAPIRRGLTPDAYALDVGGCGQGLTVRESHVDRFGQQTWLEIRRASHHGGSA